MKNQIVPFVVVHLLFVLSGCDTPIAMKETSKVPSVRKSGYTYALYNGAGLPASPFRTDDWPVVMVEKNKGK